MKNQEVILGSRNKVAPQTTMKTTVFALSGANKTPRAITVPKSIAADNSHNQRFFPGFAKTVRVKFGSRKKGQNNRSGSG
ncbi:MAG: hypothetical protein A2583_09200 [Bdellovibrionales bacterium RIFOXYD1_FULL_53_11]|nr:MAG: hypothetical protein A2583_09200 [Bdellovibrionales bacterium RIFOXYD1_FULL_53_11]